MEQKITIYTDGSCISNPGGKGGWAFIASWQGKHLYRSGYSPKTTNNRMELTACLEGLKEIKHRVPGCENKIMVYTDSQYVILCIEGYHRWLMKKKKTIKNPDLVEELVMLSESVSAKWRWVKGHNGDALNEKCDVLATRAAKYQKSFMDFTRSSLPLNA